MAFGKVTIVGVGLLGGSLGLALKHYRLAAHVHGVGHREATLEQAQALGAIDDYALTLDEDAAAADLIVLCTPAAAVPDYLDTLRPICPPAAIVTDVASTKGLICGYARDTWPHPRRFIGSHPMAGSEKWGPEHAVHNLYHSSVTFVEQGLDLDPAARDAIVGLWTRLGAHVVDVDPTEHDVRVACTSHLPHITAAALAGMTGSVEQVRPFIGGGWRDVTRIADGRPEIWRDICLTNAPAISECLDVLLKDLQQVREAVEARDAEKLMAFFRAGQEGRWRALGP
jgi:prephenate dehydrogenase